MSALDNIRELIAPDMEKVNQLILDQLHSRIDLIHKVGEHLINSGGKRLRPILVLLSAGACQYQGDQHYLLAAIIEFIHTATLLHDDVVDHSLLRRGQETANALWGDNASVLVGDFVYSRSFQMMVQLENFDVMSVLANTTNQIAEGEVLQLINARNPNTTVESYLEVIKNKTAILFSAACELAAVIANSDNSVRRALAKYGLNLGVAFQLIDDALDYSSSAEEMGKNIGDDLSEGKLTLPLLRVLQVGNEQEQNLIKQTITTFDPAALPDIQTAIARNDAIEFARQMATGYVNAAVQNLQALPKTPYRDALSTLAQFTLDRTH